MRKTVQKPKVTLILGSAPDALEASGWAGFDFENIVVINNAWQVRSDWNYLIYPEDFPTERLPESINQQTQNLVTANDYVPVQNEYGGFVYAGGTMAFTAGYWALGALKPDILAFFGCDMNYATLAGKTHFYGDGTADPLRNDVTLQSLEAKSARLMHLAAAQRCLTVNLSSRKNTRLAFPRLDLDELANMRSEDVEAWGSYHNRQDEKAALEAVLKREAELGYFVPSGRYWERAAEFDAKALREIDALWLELTSKNGPSAQTNSEPRRAKAS
jgi:hypothetical protein